jgi:hypothetical protein
MSALSVQQSLAKQVLTSVSLLTLLDRDEFFIICDEPNLYFDQIRYLEVANSAKKIFER